MLSFAVCSYFSFATPIQLKMMHLATHVARTENMRNYRNRRSEDRLQATEDILFHICAVLKKNSAE
jgi:hypothetical protein